MRTSVPDSDAGADPGTTERIRTSQYRWAWVCVALTPIALALAGVVSGAVLALFGYETGDPTQAPLGPAVVAGLPALVVMVTPGILAVRLAAHALDRGDERAIVPLAIGAVATIGMVLLNLVSLVFSS